MVAVAVTTWDVRGVGTSKDPFEGGQSVESVLQTAVQHLRVTTGVIVRLCSTLLGTRRRILGSRLQSVRKGKQEADNVLSQHVRFLVARRGRGYKFLRERDPQLLSF